MEWNEEKTREGSENQKKSGQTSGGHLAERIVRLFCFFRCLSYNQTDTNTENGHSADVLVWDLSETVPLVELLSTISQLNRAAIVTKMIGLEAVKKIEKEKVSQEQIKNKKHKQGHFVEGNKKVQTQKSREKVVHEKFSVVNTAKRKY